MISDAGKELKEDPKPPVFWPTQILRVWGITDHQVRNLRKRKAINAFDATLRDGPYWGIRTDLRNYVKDGLKDPLSAPYEQTVRLAEFETRLRKVPDLTQKRLMNWGYAVCDAAMRTHVIPGTPPPAGFPFPEAGVG
jgi:NTE family protein